MKMDKMNKNDWKGFWIIYIGLIIVPAAGCIIGAYFDPLYGMCAFFSLFLFMLMFLSEYYDR